MFFYIVAYLLVIGLSWLSEHPHVLLSFSLFGNKEEAEIGASGQLASEHVVTHILFVLSGLILVLVKGFRCGIGVDYFYTYVPKFQDAYYGNDITWGDPLYNGLIRICSLVSNDYRIFFFIEAALFILLVYGSIHLLRTNRTVSVSLFLLGFFFVQSMNMQAQFFSAAVALFGFAVAVLAKRKIIGVLIAGCSVLFHSTSIVLLALLALWLLVDRFQGRSQKAVLLVSGLLPVVVLFSRSPLRSFVATMLSGTRFGVYFWSSFDSGELSGYLVCVNLTLLLFYFVYSVIGMRAGKQLLIPKIQIDVIFIQSIILSATLLTGAIPLMARVVNSMMFLNVLIVPIFLTTGDCPMRPFAGLAILAAFALTHFCYLSPTDTDHVIPYVSVFDSDEKIRQALEEIEEWTGKELAVALPEGGRINYQATRS